MHRQLSDDRYVHTALFPNEEEAQAALEQVKEAGLSNEQLALFMLHEKKAPEELPSPNRGDGKKGLILGLLIGAGAGLVMSIVLAQFGVLSGFFNDTALFGLFGGMFIGGLSAGLYGMGLQAAPRLEEKPLSRPGNCLVTAKTFNLKTILQVEDIFKKHHALAATN